MSVTEQRRRPSPHPTKTPHNVTVGNSPLSMEKSHQPAVERETAPDRPETLHSPITDGDAGVWRWQAVKAYFTMPSPLAEQAPGIDQIRAYADRAPWTPKADGPVRAAGAAYARLVAIPYLVWSRTREWLVARPARLIVTAVTVKLLTFLPPVAWAVDHLVKPAINAAIWLFL